MSILNELREAFEKRGTVQHPEYVCNGCGAHFELRRHVCPDCGGFLIEHEKWSGLPAR